MVWLLCFFSLFFSFRLLVWSFSSRIRLYFFLPHSPTTLLTISLSDIIFFFFLCHNGWFLCFFSLISFVCSSSGCFVFLVRLTLVG
ncbi:hypothetical protein EDC01DRAFT_75642 [Geopyxis carbonaria]|nr:hypothetical protein EDC01DRAFT_75642 [Geopyxis carbonaria]